MTGGSRTHHNWFYNHWEPLDEPDMWTDEAIVQVHVDEWTNVRYEHNHYGESEPKKGAWERPTPTRSAGDTHRTGETETPVNRSNV